MSRPLMMVGAIVFVVFVVIVLFAFSYGLRRYLGSGRKSADEFSPKIPPSEDAPAFMTASMQAVIQRLREQEKELERLHRLEKERAQQTERMSEAVTRHMPTGLLLIGSNGLITYSNPAAATILGMQTLQYRRFWEALTSDSPLSRLITQCMEEAKTFHREQVEHAPPSGEKRQLGVTISPVFDTRASSAGRVSGAVCLLSDLTEMVALQRQVQLKESLASLGELSAGIAHEFKNSLATVSGYAQMLCSETLTPDQRESAERILAQTRAMTHMVTEFLRFARPLELSAAPVNARALVTQMANELREKKPGLEIVMDGDFGEISGDEMLLRQALQNLLLNASEAVSNMDGGKVRIFGAIEKSGERLNQQISIMDNGPGIDLADQSRLFLPFYTTKTGGTGLGLAVVQKIVVNHGGFVIARNHAGGGAEFLVSLPIRQEVAPEAVESVSDSI